MSSQAADKPESPDDFWFSIADELYATPAIVPQAEPLKPASATNPISSIDSQPQTSSSAPKVPDLVPAADTSSSTTAAHASLKEQTPPLTPSSPYYSFRRNTTKSSLLPKSLLTEHIHSLGLSTVLPPPPASEFDPPGKKEGSGFFDTSPYVQQILAALTHDEELIGFYKQVLDAQKITFETFTAEFQQRKKLTEMDIQKARQTIADGISAGKKVLAALEINKKLINDYRAFIINIDVNFFAQLAVSREECLSRGGAQGVHRLDNFVFGTGGGITQLLTIKRHLKLDNGSLTWEEIQQGIKDLLQLKKDDDVICLYGEEGRETIVTPKLVRGYMPAYFNPPYFNTIAAELTSFFRIGDAYPFPIRCEEVRELWSRVVTLAASLHKSGHFSVLDFLCNNIVENYLTGGYCLQGRINRTFLNYVTLLGSIQLRDICFLDEIVDSWVRLKTE